MTLDLTNDEEVKLIVDETINRLGQIDILVNNVGAGFPTIIGSEIFMQNYDKTMRLNIRTAVYLAHLTVSYLEKTKE
jgi:short-subunit dehydrogenase